MSGTADRDLIVLAADKDMELAIRGILTRRQSLSIREVSADVYTHPQRDPGCARRCDDFLRSFCRQYRHALVLFDLEGSGYPGRSREHLESDVEDRLASSGWHDRAAAVVLEPELEAWVWSDSPHVPKVLGWSSAEMELHSWLRSKGLLGIEEVKPVRPKEAMEAVLVQSRKRRSSSLYSELAQRVSVHRCSDRAFLKFISRLQQWFPSV